MRKRSPPVQQAIDYINEHRQQGLISTASTSAKERPNTRIASQVDFFHKVHP